MKLVTIQLTERHLGYCYDLIENLDAKKFARTIVAIEDALKANTDGPAALLTVTVNPDNIAGIYEKASGLPEGYANVINLQIADVLMPQLMPYAYQEGVEKATAEYMAQQANDQEQARVDALNAEHAEDPEWTVVVPVLVQPEVTDMTVTETLMKIQAVNARNTNEREENIAASIQRAKAA